EPGENVQRVAVQARWQWDSREGGAAREHDLLNISGCTGGDGAPEVQARWLGAGRRTVRHVQCRAAALRLANHGPLLGEDGLALALCRQCFRKISLDGGYHGVYDGIRGGLGVEVAHEAWGSETRVVGGDDGIALGKPVIEVRAIALAAVVDAGCANVVHSHRAVGPGEDRPAAFGRGALGE